MNDREPAQPHAQPGPEQIRETRELLEGLGAPSDAHAPNDSDLTANVNHNDLSQSSVQPSAGLLNELSGSNNNVFSPRDELNNRDGDADVLPR